MKFLEREELANYNFQNEFLRPFVIVMQKSNAPEVRELIISSQFSSDANLNAIAFLRFCAVKLAEEGFVCRDSSTEQLRNSDMSDGKTTLHTDDHVSLWVPLLAGLAKLTADPRLTIKKGAVGVLFDILKDHGHMFSQTFWTDIFERVVYPLFSSEKSIPKDEISTSAGAEYNLPALETQTLAVKCLVGLFINFFDVIRPEFARTAAVVTYFVRSPYKHCATTGVSAIIRLTEGVGNKLSMEEWKEILVSFKESVMHTFVGFSKIVRMMQDIEVPDRFESYSEAEQYSDHEVYGNDEEEANMETTSYAIVKLKNHMALLLIVIQCNAGPFVTSIYPDHFSQLPLWAVPKLKFLFCSQLYSTLFLLCRTLLNYMRGTGDIFLPEHISILLEMVSAIAAHSSEMSSESSLQMKFHKACSILEVSEPAIVHFENESYQSYLKFLQDLQHDHASLSEKMNIESQVLHACEIILRLYLKCAGQESDETSRRNLSFHCTVPLSTAKKEELAARTSLVLQVMKLLGDLERDSFRRILPCFFPLLIDLIRCEHSSGEVQHALYNIFRSVIGPMILHV
ncbi:hypothetical protein PR202_ga14922 [Eleusine coracana subsp. coracana]|uniref:Uncharacterized protein n=1 Tax=Eleusine coracana subsp. coracana TaxID=191504 RepID=A0AAV5CJ01_ELECO|nr:hypothetical protein PR202_ga14922 [Eleusine coracana subsp. coracana]